LFTAQARWTTRRRSCHAATKSWDSLSDYQDIVFNSRNSRLLLHESLSKQSVEGTWIGCLGCNKSVRRVQDSSIAQATQSVFKRAKKNAKIICPHLKCSNFDEKLEPWRPLKKLPKFVWQPIFGLVIQKRNGPSLRQIQKPLHWRQT